MLMFIYHHQVLSLVELGEVVLRKTLRMLMLQFVKFHIERTYCLDKCLLKASIPWLRDRRVEKIQKFNVEETANVFHWYLMALKQLLSHNRDIRV
ncbi:hypothetical protein TNCT_300331 [Trichonephila clavata]|uniref:Uncharacterized protein n=1 Tax=Trichonephila clavata TaxID=2740835 RepID=A0A8X6M0I4_TRICU|nr:hypothetical protein TNCT_300331 [Trichonephila clavata]